jgi:hypothetical protein
MSVYRCNSQEEINLQDGESGKMSVNTGAIIQSIIATVVLSLILGGIRIWHDVETIKRTNPVRFSQIDSRIDGIQAEIAGISAKLTNQTYSVVQGVSSFCMRSADIYSRMREVDTFLENLKHNLALVVSENFAQNDIRADLRLKRYLENIIRDIEVAKDRIDDLEILDTRKFIEDFCRTERYEASPTYVVGPIVQ